MPVLLTNKPSSEDQGAPVGPDQGVIEEARRRQRTRRLGISLAVLLAMAGAGILIAATAGRKPPTEAPLHLPPEPTPLSAGHLESGAQSRVVHLSPNLEGGQAGWCVTILDRDEATGSCGPLPTFSHPLLYASSGWTHGDRYVSTTEITAPRVAYFLVNGVKRIATRPLPGVPYGLRIATIHTPLHGSPGRLGPSALHAPTLVPLDAQGKRIAEAPDHGASWFRDWNPPAAPLGGPCQLRVSGLAKATPKWGQIATAIRPYPAPIVGRGFLSCVDTEYFIPGFGLRAAVLLDATDPLHATPAAIPGLVPIPQAPGLYNGAGNVQLGPMTARRDGRAWIVVAGSGRNAEQARILLLRHLRVTPPS